jgi:hypothetical protein
MAAARKLAHHIFGDLEQPGTIGIGVFITLSKCVEKGCSVDFHGGINIARLVV